MTSDTDGALSAESADADGEAEAGPPAAAKWNNVRDSLHPSVFRAITTHPFKYSDMSPVQEEVVKRLKDITRFPAGTAPLPTVEVDDQKLGNRLATILKPENQGALDTLVRARTGTGKTLGFLIPAIEARATAISAAHKGITSPAFSRYLQEKAPRFDWNAMSEERRHRFAATGYTSSSVGALILSPTRELAAQIAVEAEKLSNYFKDFGVHLLVGGESRRAQLKKLGGPKDIIVATPGRLKDLLQENLGLREAVSCTETFILDEADTMLAMGFREAIAEIQQYLPPKEETRNMFFSATVSPTVRQVSADILKRNFAYVDCVPAGEPEMHERVPSYAHIVQPEDHFPTLLRLIAHDQMVHGNKSKVIVFCNTTKQTQVVAKLLKSNDIMNLLPSGKWEAKTRGFTRGSSPSSFKFVTLEIHSNLDQDQRSKVSSRFRAARGGGILVTSDVSARGVDYPNVTRVIQFMAPEDSDTYVHRIGRTGRAGKSGRGDLILQKGYEEGWLVGAGRSFSKSIQVDQDGDGADAFRRKLVKRWEAHCEENKGAYEKYGSPAESVIAGADVSKLRQTVQKTIRGRVADQLGGDSAEDVNDALYPVYTSLVGARVNKPDVFRADKLEVFHGIQAWAEGALGMERDRLRLSSKLSQMLGLDGRGGGGIKRGGFGAGRGGRGGGGFSSRGGGSFGGRPRDGGHGGYGSRDRDGGFGARREGGFRSRDRDAGDFGGRGRGAYQRGGSSSFGGRRDDRGSRSYPSRGGGDDGPSW